MMLKHSRDSAHDLSMELSPRWCSCPGLQILLVHAWSVYDDRKFKTACLGLLHDDQASPYSLKSQLLLTFISRLVTVIFGRLQWPISHTGIAWTFHNEDGLSRVSTTECTKHLPWQMITHSGFIELFQLTKQKVSRQSSYQLFTYLTRILGPEDIFARVYLYHFKDALAPVTNPKCP